MFGLTVEKLIVIVMIAVFLIGPERLPAYAARFGQFVRTLRSMADTAKTRLKDELGDDFDEVEWKKLDPRQYDPRRIIREAVADTDPNQRTPTPTPADAAAPGTPPQVARPAGRWTSAGRWEALPIEESATAEVTS